MFSRVVLYRDAYKSLSSICYKPEMHARFVSLKTPRDNGPGKNYRKKVKKLLKKESGEETTDDETVETNTAVDASQISESFLDQLQNTEGQTAASETVDLSDILSDIKIYIRPDDGANKKNMEKPHWKTQPVLSRSSNIKTVSPKVMKNLSFTEGKRLGIFNEPSPDAAVMSPDAWNFFEEDNDKQVALLNSIRLHANSIEKLMNESSSSVWNYPINNEAYKNDEESVGFEKHIFLEKELENGFPKKGPVRHFMELVVTGLSKNPHYSPEEKMSHISWYREYFSQFPEDELHVAVPSETMSDDQSPQQQ